MHYPCVFLAFFPIQPRSPPLNDSQASLLLTSIIDTFPDHIYSQLGRKHCITAENLMLYIAEMTQSQSTRETLGICQVLLEDAVIKPRKILIQTKQNVPIFSLFKLNKKLSCEFCSYSERLSKEKKYVEIDKNYSYSKLMVWFDRMFWLVFVTVFLDCFWAFLFWQ